jgi:hypothetical protein
LAKNKVANNVAVEEGSANTKPEKTEVSEDLDKN